MGKDRKPQPDKKGAKKEEAKPAAGGKKAAPAAKPAAGGKKK